MLKTILTPDNTNVQLSIPQESVGKKVEVLLYAIDEVTEAQPKKKQWLNTEACSLKKQPKPCKNM